MLKKIFLFISVFLVFLIPVNASSIPVRDMDEYISKMDIPVTPDLSNGDFSLIYEGSVPLSEMKYIAISTSRIYNSSNRYCKFRNFEYVIYWSSEPLVWNTSTNSFSFDNSKGVHAFGTYYIDDYFLSYSSEPEHPAGYYSFMVGFSGIFNSFGGAAESALVYSNHKIYDSENNLVFRPAPQAVVSKETAQGLVETILANRNLILGSTLCLVVFLLLLKVLYKGLWTFSQIP